MSGNEGSKVLLRCANKGHVVYVGIWVEGHLAQGRLGTFHPSSKVSLQDFLYVICGQIQSCTKSTKVMCVPAMLHAVKHNAPGFWQGCECMLLVPSHAAEALLLNKLKNAELERRGRNKVV